MNNKRTRHTSIDGFVLSRRAPTSRGTQKELTGDTLRVPERFLNVNAKPESEAAPEPERELPRPQSAPVLRRGDIDASLDAIDNEKPTKKRARRHGQRRRIPVKRIIVAFIILIVLAVAFFAIRAFIDSSKIFKGNLFDLLSAGTPLKTDQYGRSNILIFGTSEDDPGHDGADLTDSIMILSLDQKNKNAGMISVPRDLWVKYGKACPAGYEGKINAIYSCFSQSGGEEAGANALKQNIGDDFGVDIQYYAHINYTVVKEAVDAVGGVEVTIQSPDPRGILDRNFDWQCRYTCYYVKYPNGPTGIIDGQHALFLARARGDDNGQATYGLGNGNFDREKNQQKILTALKNKATSAGTLANPVAVTNLLSALGNNVRTNFTGGEVKTLITLGKDIPADKIKSISLIDPGSSVVTTGNVGGQSIVRPIAGVYDFGDIQSYVRKKLQALAGEEAAVVDILNGSSKLGVASAEAKKIQAAGLEVGTIGDTDANNYPAISWYDVSGGKNPKTAAKLKETLGVESAGTKLPAGVQASGDFVIIIGDGAN